MITYQYRGVSADGAKVKGVVQAIDEYAAVTKIKATCPIVLKITPVEENAKGKMNILTMELGKPKIDAKALSVMCSQFAIILKSGVSIGKCMEMIAGQTADKKLKKMLEKSAEDVMEGTTMADAFEKNCKGLPVTFTETIRAGEHSGTLERSFETLETYFSRSYKTAAKVKKALSYPIFVICLAVVVLIVVMIKVVPSLTKSFSDLGGELPGITKFLIAMSDFFKDNIFIIIGVIILLAIAFKWITNKEKGRIKWAEIKLKIPILGNIAILNGASQFANTMAALMTAGLGVHQAIEVTAKVMDNYALSLDIAKMTGSIQEGKKLGDCMKQSKYFPKTLVEMTAIGEETGEIETTLDTIGRYFDGEAETATEKALSKLEPALLVCLAGFAGFIVIAIYLPMFKVYEMI